MRDIRNVNKPGREYYQTDKEIEYQDGKQWWNAGQDDSVDQALSFKWSPI